MVQWFLNALHDSFLRLVPALPWLGWAALAVLALLVLLRVADPRRYETLLGALPARRFGAVWLWPLLALLAGVLALNLASDLIAHRVSSELGARTVNRADPEGSPTVQSAPTATYLVTRTYTRTLLLPPELLRRVGEQGVGVLAPYLTDPSSDNILKLVDRFRRSGGDVVFTREAIQISEAPIRFDASNVGVSLRFQEAGGHGQYYNADFDAKYSFQNPTAEAVTARFRFPLPGGSGTLTNFRVTVNGQELTAAQLTGGTQWQGELTPNQKVVVRVTYRHQGARGWSYALAGRREPVRNFDLRLSTDRPAKFLRYSLYPTSVQRNLLGQPGAFRWTLPDALTAQDIALSFGTSSARETVVKFFRFAPLTLLLAAAFTPVWVRSRRLTLRPGPAALASLGIVAGLGLGGVLMSYLPLGLAGLIGAAVAGALGLRALGPAFWPPVLLAALAPLAFLTGGHAGLLLALAAALALALLIFTPGPGRRRPAPPSATTT